MFNLNEVEPTRPGELIPDGSYAKVVMALRPGGVDGQVDIDKGLLKASTAPGSDVLSLDAEFTVTEGPHARRKFWHTFTVMGGKLDEKGVSMGWTISKRMFRAMVDSALGLDPEDMSDEAMKKRQLRGLADLNGIGFVAKISVEPSRDARYPDQNRLDRPVLPNEKEWKLVMEGQTVPASPTRQRSAANGAPKPPAAAAQPAWAVARPAAAPTAPVAPAPAWSKAPANQAPAVPPSPAAKPTGPAWLNS